MCTQILITCPIRGECDTHSCSGTLSYDRFGMNKKRLTAYDGSGALFLGRETESLVREGEGRVSGELLLLALEFLGGDGAGEPFGEGDFVA